MTNQGHKEIVNILIAAKAHINVKDKHGRTALTFANNNYKEALFANKNNYKKIVDILKKAGAK